MIAGQNPGTNHPRMLSALEIAKKNGAKIIAINPLKEAGLVRFKNPQTPARAWWARHRARRPVPADADQRRPGAVPGDRALLLEGARVDHDFVERAHRRLRRLGRAPARPRLGPGAGARPGSPAPRSRRPPRCSPPRAGPSTAGRWASPSTATPSPPSRRSSTSPSSRATSASPAPGCARCAATPTCRATAPWASGSGCPTTSSTRCATSSASSRRASTASTASAPIKALRDGNAKVFFGLGGNFVSATPDTVVTEDALRGPT